MNELPSTIVEAARRLRNRELTSTELVEALIDKADEYDPALGVFISRSRESSLEAAQQADNRIRRGEARSILDGIPLGIKDIIATREYKTTAQSEALWDDWGAGVDADVTRNLRDSGSVILGKTTTMEFSHGLPTPKSSFPIPRNPWDLERWAGGSSSGSASGVAAGLFYGGIGTDTGGSIRAPAAYCGVTGFKPTYGRGSLDGILPNSPSMDHVGPIARTARDCAALHAAILGPDLDRDEREQLDHITASTNAGPLVGWRIGILPETLLGSPPVASSVLHAFEQAARRFQDLGAALVEIEFARYRTVADAHSIISMAEKYHVHRKNLARSWERYGRNTRLMSGQGALVSAADYLDAQSIRRWASGTYSDQLRSVDVLITPTTASTAPLLDGLSFETLFSNHVSFTGIWSFLGFPAISVPMGLDDKGMPIGLQVIGQLGDDLQVLSTAVAFQSATKHHLSSPPIDRRGEPVQK